jgi:hypothetical protein
VATESINSTGKTMARILTAIDLKSMGCCA